MTKREARQEYKLKRKELSAPERAKLDDLLLIQFQMMELPHIDRLLSFWPIEENNEPNTHLFNDYVEFLNPAIKFLYPRADFERSEMEAIEVTTDSAFKKNARNIHEPLDGTIVDAGVIDMVFVPLLIFDKRGFRVGYGKGFYDKYLKTCRADCIKLGFSYFEPVDVIEDTSDFDVPLTGCITPNNIYVF